MFIERVSRVPALRQEGHVISQAESNHHRLYSAVLGKPKNGGE